MKDTEKKKKNVGDVNKPKVQLLPYENIKDNPLITCYITENPQMVLLACAEEMAELSQAIIKKLRGAKSNAPVVEEIADVLLSVEYVRKACGITYDEVQQLIDFKLDRLGYRIDRVSVFERATPDKFRYLKKAILTEIESKSSVGFPDIINPNGATLKETDKLPDQISYHQHLDDLPDEI